MTCKDCIHYNVCVIVEHRVDEDEDHLSEFGCEDFINKNDVVEVVHASWVERKEIFYESEGQVDAIGCSNCGKSQRIYYRTKYCPNCGAKMDGKKVE